MGKSLITGCIVAIFASVGLQVHVNTDITDTAAVVLKLDSADLIVPLVSCSFIRNDDWVMALQVAINRQRYCKGLCYTTEPCVCSI